MNGRAYDYQLGRFLSVDPIIQFPTNSQSLNPYSYILNNPLAGTDPTGYQSCTNPETLGQCDFKEVGSRISKTAEIVPDGKGGVEFAGKNTVGGKIVMGPGSSLGVSLERPGSGSVGQGTKPSGSSVGAVTDAKPTAAPIHGNAQASQNTPTHASTSQRVANELAAKSTTKSVHLNQSLRKITRNPKAPNIRPDVCCINTNGTIDMVEVRSTGQTTAELESKLTTARGAMPQSGRNIVIEPDPVRAAPGGLRGPVGPAAGALGIIGFIQIIFHEYVNQVERERARSTGTCEPPDCV
jgi:hypothetical protein